MLEVFKAKSTVRALDVNYTNFLHYEMYEFKSTMLVRLRNCVVLFSIKNRIIIINYVS